MVHFYWVVAWRIRNRHCLVLEHHHYWLANWFGDFEQHTSDSISPTSKERNPGIVFGRGNEDN
jgi:hypothetical protein